MKRAIFLLTVFCLPLIGWSQYEIKGKITQEETGDPLAGAHVQVLGSYRATATDYRGKFNLKNLPEGKLQLKITYVGYQADTVSIEVSGDQTLDIQLNQRGIISDEVIVSATRADRGIPTTYDNLEKKEIRKENLGQDMPYVLEHMPSVVSTSDAGNGIGYNGLRIRGTAPTRVNVTINGIPLNDAESQGVFWVDIPDIATSTENIQVQRGVGTSTNGAGAFGATINLQTTTLEKDPYMEVNNTVGSFNTLKNNIRFGTGLLNGQWNFNGALSRVESDGYIDRAASNLKSYYFSASYRDENTLLKGITFSGKEKTYQAWYGVHEDFLGSYPAGQRYLGALGKFIYPDSTYNKGNPTHNPYTYENETDNYQQDHYQLHFSQNLSRYLNANAALHLTRGRGYYEQYREDASLKFHDIQPIMIGNDTITHSDLVRRRWLDNYFYGLTYSLNYNDLNRMKATLGGAWNIYDGGHYGEVIWARYAGKSEIREKFYDNNALKNDFNVFGKLTYRLSPKLQVFGDLQYRKVAYETRGLDIDERDITQDTLMHFINPKVGLDYQINSNNSLYVFFGISNREPTRNDFIDAPDGRHPKAETLRNLELGYRANWDKAALKLNAYLMDYRNQLVQTGKLNDVGAAVRTNVKSSYRAGLEIISSLQLHDKIWWNVNLTLSQNKIQNFREVIYAYTSTGIEQRTNSYKNTDISFSPPVIGGSELSFEPFRNFTVSLLSKYVGRQYLDNTSNPNRIIEDYLRNDLQLTYNLDDFWVFREAGLNLMINNLLDVRYESRGYTFSYYSGNDLVTQNYYYPQAGIHYMAMLSLEFQRLAD